MYRLLATFTDVCISEMLGIYKILIRVILNNISEQFESIIDVD